MKLEAVVAGLLGSAVKKSVQSLLLLQIIDCLNYLTHLGTGLTLIIALLNKLGESF